MLKKKVREGFHFFSQSSKHDNVVKGQLINKKKHNLEIEYSFVWSILESKKLISKLFVLYSSGDKRPNDEKYTVL